MLLSGCYGKRPGWPEVPISVVGRPFCVQNGRPSIRMLWARQRVRPHSVAGPVRAETKSRRLDCALHQSTVLPGLFRPRSCWTQDRVGPASGVIHVGAPDTHHRRRYAAPGSSLRSARGHREASPRRASPPEVVRASQLVPSIPVVPDFPVRPARFARWTAPAPPRPQVPPCRHQQRTGAEPVRPGRRDRGRPGPV